MARIKIGSRVSTEAWRFDKEPVAFQEWWPYLRFGEPWVEARVIRTVKEKSGNWWLVKWEIDEETVSWETEFLLKEDDEIPLQGIPK